MTTSTEIIIRQSYAVCVEFEGDTLRDIGAHSVLFMRKKAGQVRGKALGPAGRGPGRGQTRIGSTTSGIPWL